MIGLPVLHLLRKVYWYVMPFR